jgi:hypothetical protein
MLDAPSGLEPFTSPTEPAMLDDLRAPLRATRPTREAHFAA